jgi:hypothetical protein
VLYREGGREECGHSDHHNTTLKKRAACFSEISIIAYMFSRCNSSGDYSLKTIDFIRMLKNWF